VPAQVLFPSPPHPSTIFPIRNLIFDQIDFGRTSRIEMFVRIRRRRRSKRIVTRGKNWSRVRNERVGIRSRTSDWCH